MHSASPRFQKSCQLEVIGMGWRDGRAIKHVTCLRTSRPLFSWNPLRQRPIKRICYNLRAFLVQPVGVSRLALT